MFQISWLNNKVREIKHKLKIRYQPKCKTLKSRTVETSALFWEEGFKFIVFPDVRVDFRIDSAVTDPIKKILADGETFAL